MSIAIPPNGTFPAPRLRVVSLAPDVFRARVLRGLPVLTAREWEVLNVLATGATNAQIARTVDLAEGTVRNVIARLTCKLGVADRTQAALLAFRCGLGETSAPRVDEPA